MGLFSKIFGGSSSKSSSKNRAYDTINAGFSPLIGQAQSGADAFNSFMGGDSTGFNRFKDAAGFDFLADQGSRGITGNAAASGLLRSGSTGKALANFNSNLTSQYANQYLDKLMQQMNTGMQAGNLITQAGQESTSKGSSNKGIGGFLGGVLSGFAGG